MGIDRRAKGRRIELKARKLLESLGYLVEKKNTNRWESPDFYGMFDLMAIMSGTTRLIQIKSNPTDFYKARKEIKEWVKENKVKVPCEIWLYEGRNNWRMEELS